MDNVTKFLVYCVEIYKTANKLNGKQVIKLFNENGVSQYITDCYGALHTTGAGYIIEDIDEYIANREG